jgi:hypothetical protein
VTTRAPIPKGQSVRGSNIERRDLNFLHPHRVHSKRSLAAPTWRRARSRKSIFRRYLIVHARIKTDPNDHLSGRCRDRFSYYGKKPRGPFVFLGTHIYSRCVWSFRQEAAEREIKTTRERTACILNLHIA